MPRGSEFYGEHGRTAVNGAGCERSRFHSYHNDGDNRSRHDYGSSQFSEERGYDGPQSIGRVYRSRSLYNTARGTYDRSFSLTFSSTPRSHSVRASIERISTANGHRVRLATPNEQLGRDLRDMSMDELDGEYAHVRGRAATIDSSAENSAVRPRLSQRMIEYCADGSENTATPQVAGHDSARYGGTRASGGVSAFNNLDVELKLRRRAGGPGR